MKEKEAKKSRKKATDKDKYPSEYSLIFDGIVAQEGSESNDVNQEINELRKAAISINEPKYTYTTSSSVYNPVVTIR
ncbi:MAG: hypothetical protein M3Q99_14255 [Acidobacteriota bacterium]|nr:hypothetical protein [Acidobacteriota bacterium]